MPAATRDINQRIRSVQNTRKITKAMELVASAKMRKASQAVVGTRPYANRAWDMLLNLAKRTEPDRHPLLRATTPLKKIAVILIASNRGLVGGFNAQIVSAVSKYIQEFKTANVAEVDTVIMGTKSRAIFFQHGHEIAAEFMKQDITLDAAEVRPMAKLVIDGFTSGTYDRVIVGFMDFVSSLVQRPAIRQVLPLTAEAFSTGQSGIISKTEREGIVAEEAAEERAFEYLFEPDADIVLDALLPRLVEMQIFRAVLETNAAEHAARMVAMRNASDAANDLIDGLTLTFTQARQAAITQDLAEISAGRAALENA
ncbi:MAG: ATP synthase F1 subunit gamma [Candidatus Kerfeldbacteria bacterium]|nr:ATP synthase F1 subunit gamma [Candidatus Kerfeldbacteria bacterium]